MKDRVPEGIEIACHNGPDSCTLSGPSEQVEEFVKKLSAEGVFARAVNVANIPYHSKYIKGMGPRMEEYLKHVSWKGTTVCSTVNCFYGRFPPRKFNVD